MVDVAATVGETAVVVGASMAGLCAARVLADRFAHVIVLDRDDLNGGVRWRQQVPQGRHPHLLLPAGARLLDSWFPDLVDEVLRLGAVEVDLCRDFYWYQSGGVWKRPSSSLTSPAMSRPLLESVIRRRVDQIANVTLRGGSSAVGLEVLPDGSRVTGVQLAHEETVGSQLLVDATGRRARSLAWLESLGYAPPALSTVEINTRYVTCRYRRVADPARDWQAAAVVAQPGEKRLAMVMPVEPDGWLVTFVGLNGEAAPTENGDLLAYAESLPSPVVADIIRTSARLGDPITHRFPTNQRRHVERLRRFPLGWILLGDAISSFDPIYGQGMTSAAQQAAALGACLDRTGRIDRRFTRRYFRAAGRIVDVPWSIAVGGDFVYDGTTGPKPFATDLLNSYLDRMSVAAQHDDQVLLRLNEVIALVRPPEALLTPRIAVRTLRASRRCRTPHDQRAR
jgi:2-polyprenyl-6-methoxyphenol hydroxylase-like FAD-dependent oxidoreductase